MDEKVRIAGRAEPRVERDPTRRVEADLGIVLSRRRERHLSDSEIPAFWRGLDSLPLVWATFARVILLCGTRRGETYAARWTHLDLDGDAPTWFLPAETRKGQIAGPAARRELTVPLSPLAVRLFRDLRAATGRHERVFFVGHMRWEAGRPTAQSISLSNLGTAAQPATGIRDITIHDLRRSYASGLQRLGAPPHVVSVVLGHAREHGATLVDAAYMHDRRTQSTGSGWSAGRPTSSSS